MGAVTFGTVKLVKGGVVSGDNKAAGTLTSSFTDYTFGGPTDLWGLSLDPADANASNFGVAVSLEGSGWVENYTANLIVATGFENSVSSTVRGVVVKVRAKVDGDGLSYIDSIQMNVYTENVNVVRMVISNA